ncbi:MAG: hypothetical protein AAFZ49_00150 [Cyanobacteria bacterium J06659_2]
MDCPLLAAIALEVPITKPWLRRIKGPGGTGTLGFSVDAEGKSYTSVRWDWGGVQVFNSCCAGGCVSASKRPKKLVSISQQTITGASEWMGVFPYPSHGKRYWRFQWGEGARVLGQKHIPGGACDNPTAKARANEVARWVRLGYGRAQILQGIKAWKHHKGNSRAVSTLG